MTPQTIYNFGVHRTDLDVYRAFLGPLCRTDDRTDLIMWHKTVVGAELEKLLDKLANPARVEKLDRVTTLSVVDDRVKYRSLTVERSSAKQTGMTVTRVNTVYTAEFTNNIRELMADIYTLALHRGTIPMETGIITCDACRIPILSHETMFGLGGRAVCDSCRFTELALTIREQA